MFAVFTVGRDIALSETLITYLIGFGLPIVTGLLIKAHLSNKLKVLVNIVLNLVVALLRQALDNKGILTQSMMLDFSGQLAISILSYYGIWKPAGLGNLFPGKGLGGVNPEEYGLIDGPGPEFEGE